MAKAGPKSEAGAVARPQSAEVRAALVGAAIDALRETGFAGASAREIAGRAGVIIFLLVQVLSGGSYGFDIPGAPPTSPETGSEALWALIAVLPCRNPARAVHAVPARTQTTR